MGNVGTRRALVEADRERWPNVADHGHSGGETDCKRAAHHEHVAGLSALFNAENIQNVEQEGEKCDKEHGGRDKQSHKGDCGQQETGKIPGPFARDAVRNEGDGTAAHKVRLGQRIDQHEREDQERDGGIAERALKGLSKAEARQKADQKNGNEARPVNGDRDPHEQRTKEDAEHSQSFRSQRARGRDEPECKYDQHSNRQIDVFLSSLRHVTAPFKAGISVKYDHDRGVSCLQCGERRRSAACTACRQTCGSGSRKKDAAGAARRRTHSERICGRHKKRICTALMHTLLHLRLPFGTHRFTE